MKVNVIVPVKDEADAVAITIPEMVRQLQFVVRNYVVIAVDNGSIDGTREVLARLPVDKIITEQQSGKPAAVLAGIRHVSDGQFLMVFDGDGQHPVSAIPRMFALSAEFPDQVIKASRFHPESPQIGVPEDRVVLNRTIRDRLCKITRWDVSDPQCGLILLPPRIVTWAKNALSWTSEWEMELLVRMSHAGMKPPIEFPIEARYSGLPGVKQVQKYSEAGRPEREARLSRQLAFLDILAGE